MVLAEAVEVQARPAASETRPADTTSFVLLRTASAVPMTEVMPVIVATGSRRTPVLNGP